MSLIARNKEADFTPVSAGTHLAMCYMLVDLGLQENPFNPKKKQHKIIIGWELPEEKLDDGRPMVISSFYNLSLFKTANLLKDLQTWRGKEFTSEELEGFDLRNVIAKPCLLSIVHEEKDGTIKTKVKGIAALPKGMAAPVLPTNQVLIYDMDTRNEDTYAMLPEWIRKMVDKGERPGEAEAEEEKVQEDIRATTNSEPTQEIPF